MEVEGVLWERGGGERKTLPFNGIRLLKTRNLDRMRAHHFQTQVIYRRGSYMKNMVIYLFVTQKSSLVKKLNTGQEMSKMFISL